MSSDFFNKVYEVVRQIPKGRVCTYGIIAKTIGSPSAARMVGWAMNASHSKSPAVPAHRVVNRKGMLSGKAHFEHQNKMQELLESEGIKVENDKVVNFEKLIWNPMEEY